MFTFSYILENAAVTVNNERSI